VFAKLTFSCLIRSTLAEETNFFSELGRIGHNVPGLGVVGFVVGQVRLENQSRLASVMGRADYSLLLNISVILG
jgi:hypothetical protein